MTAIAGRWNFDGRPDAEDDSARMLAAQAIYGPHDRSTWSDGAIGLGRALFRLLPEDRHDRQPLTGTDGTSALVADLRLDNRDELIAALGMARAEAALRCDAQILLATLERWEEEALDRIVGDFAFAWWRPRAGKLLLARDPVGQRPLHYHAGTNFFAFATMPKGLHALADIPYAPDEVRVAELLALIPEAGERSFFAGVSRVEPGHLLAVTRDGLSNRRYWRPDRVGRIDLDMDRAAEGLAAQLDQAVASRLRGGDGRVASHLSAGFDSGAVTATAARLLAPDGGRVVAFTSVPRSGYDGPDPHRRLGDEGPLAAATAALHPNIDHVRVPTEPGSPLDELDRAFMLFDRPQLNLCNLRWVVAINAEAKRRGLQVMLTGQMGNMTISYGGNEHLADLAARGRFVALFRLMLGLRRHGAMRWRGALAASFGRWCPAPLWRALNRWKGDQGFDLDDYSAVSPARFAALGLDRVARERGLDLSYRPWRDPSALRLWVLGRVDPGTFNKGMLGGWGIDQRDPTADRRLIEYCLAVPDRLWIEGGEPRALGRRALASRLPAAVLDAPRKGVQAVDWHEGLTAGRAGVREEVGRLGEVPAAAAALDLPRLGALVEDWPEEGWHRPEVVGRYRLALLRGVAAGHFLRKATRSNA